MMNEAARIESLTKYYGIKLLLSRETFAQLSEQGSSWRLVDRVIVKGKSEPVELFECESPCTSPNSPQPDLLSGKASGRWSRNSEE